MESGSESSLASGLESSPFEPVKGTDFTRATRLTGDNGGNKGSKV